MISHGNGPQVGLLALQGAAYETEVPTYPLDVLGAETQGMIGYLVEQELGNRLPFDKPLATLLTMIEVDPDDPAFSDPDEADRSDLRPRPRPTRSAAERGLDVQARRRRVPARRASPQPKRIFELRQIRWLLEHGASSSAPAAVASRPRTSRTASSSASRPSSTRTAPARCWRRDLEADVFVMATDVDAVYVDWGKPTQRAIGRAHPDALMEHRRAVPGGLHGPEGRRGVRLRSGRPAARPASAG